MSTTAMARVLWKLSQQASEDELLEMFDVLDEHFDPALRAVQAYYDAEEGSPRRSTSPTRLCRQLSKQERVQLEKQTMITLLEVEQA